MITINPTLRNQIKSLQFWLVNSAFERKMSKIVFVPLTDEMVYEHPEMITGPITTYKPNTSRTDNQSLSSKKSLHAPKIYLKGDLVTGIDVVYASGKSNKRNQD